MQQLKKVSLQLQIPEEEITKEIYKQSRRVFSQPSPPKSSATGSLLLTTSITDKVKELSEPASSSPTHGEPIEPRSQDPLNLDESEIRDRHTRNPSVSEGLSHIIYRNQETGYIVDSALPSEELWSETQIFLDNPPLTP